MPLVGFRELMDEAERGGYAVGYFESWNLESLLAVADAAERTRSPVILGFSGIYLPSPDRRVADPLGVLRGDGPGGRPRPLRARLPAVQRVAVPRRRRRSDRSRVWTGDVHRRRPGTGAARRADRAASSPAPTRRTCRSRGRWLLSKGSAADWQSVPDDHRLTDPEAARGFVERTGDRRAGREHRPGPPARTGDGSPRSRTARAAPSRTCRSPWSCTARAPSIATTSRLRSGWGSARSTSAAP